MCFWDLKEEVCPRSGFSLGFWLMNEEHCGVLMIKYGPCPVD